MSRKVRYLTVIALLLAGIGVMAYPPLSQYINALHASRAVQSYRAQLESAGTDALREQRQLAEAYNSGTAADRYEQILDFGNGVMGYLRIPDIGVELSIYHGVSDAVLQKGVGHLPTSALPIGGAGNHCVLTGHTGLPGAQLFTELTELAVGDLFYLHVLDETLVYAVDRITVVLPHETDALAPVGGRDYCTLVTCTPYGINSHRLLVRGERVPTERAEAVLREAAPLESATPFPGALILAGGAVISLLAAGTVILLKPGEVETP